MTRDQSLTLSQNYRKLGLSAKLKSSTGGTENKITKASQQSLHSHKDDPLAIPSSTSKRLEPGSVKVVRDPTSGAITGVVRENKDRPNPLNDLLYDLSDGEKEYMIGESERINGSGIIPELEKSAQYEKKRQPRKQSQREQEWIASLIERWGDDWVGMVRDRKLNPMQQSEGDLKRRVKQWQKSQEQRTQDAVEAG